MLVHRTGYFLQSPSAREVARRLYATSGICRSFRRTAIPIRAGSRTTSRSRIRRRCSSFPTITFSGCSTARACASRISASPTKDGGIVERDPRAIWRLFRGAIIISFAARRHGPGSTTPSRRCSASTSGSRRPNADEYYDRIDAALRTPEFRPRALFERFRIEAIATTESPLDPLKHHENHPPLGLERPRHHGLSARPGRRSGIRRLSATISRALAS